MTKSVEGGSHQSDSGSPPLILRGWLTNPEVGDLLVEVRELVEQRILELQQAAHLALQLLKDKDSDEELRTGGIS